MLRKHNIATAMAATVRDSRGKRAEGQRTLV